MKKLLLFFAAGCLGALANSLAVWLFGSTGINSSLGVSIAPSLTSGWLYPRIVWGGLWGLLFILPMMQSKLLMKGYHSKSISHRNSIICCLSSQSK